MIPITANAVAISTHEVPTFIVLAPFFYAQDDPQIFQSIPDFYSEL